MYSLKNFFFKIYKNCKLFITVKLSRFFLSQKFQNFSEREAAKVKPENSEAAADNENTECEGENNEESVNDDRFKDEKLLNDSKLISLS